MDGSGRIDPNGLIGALFEPEGPALDLVARAKHVFIGLLWLSVGGWRWRHPPLGSLLSGGARRDRESKQKEKTHPVVNISHTNLIRKLLAPNVPGPLSQWDRPVRLLST